MSIQLEPRRLFTGDQYSELTLACPVCGCDCTHIQRCWSLEGTDEFEGRGEFGELFGVPVGGLTDYRRGCLVIQIWGECGHTFTARFQQHKGATFIQAERVESD